MWQDCTFQKRWGRGLIGCEICVKNEGNSLGWYVKNSEELMFEAVRRQGVVKTEQAITPDVFKKTRVSERLKNWSEKVMHGQYVREMDGIDKAKLANAVYYMPKNINRMMGLRLG